MDEHPQPDASAEATAPEASSPASGDEAVVTTTEPVDTSAASATGQLQQHERQGGEEEIQPAPTSDDDRTRDTTEQQPQEIEEAGVGSGNEQATEQEEGANEDESAAVAGGEGSKTSFSLKNPKSAMVVLILIEGDEITLEKKVSGSIQFYSLFTHCGWCSIRGCYDSEAFVTPSQRFLSVDHTCEIGLSVNLCVM